MEPTTDAILTNPALGDSCATQPVKRMILGLDARDAYRMALAIAMFCVLYVKIDGGFLTERWASLGVRAGEVLSWSEFISKRLVFFLFHATAIWIVCAVALCGKRGFQVAFASLYLFFVFCDLAYLSVTGRYPSLPDVAVLNDAVDNLPQAVREYWRSFLVPAAYAIGVSIFFVVVGSLKTARWSGKALLHYCVSPLAGLFVLFCISAVHYGESGLVGFPRGFSYAYSTLLVEGDRRIWAQAGRNTPILPAKSTTLQADRILVVMDESVEASRFNALARNADLGSMIFFRHAFSGANISASSNYFFRRGGLNPTPLPIMSHFELAKEQGYNTVYIDCQGVLKDLNVRNYFDTAEVKAIDRHIDYSDRLKPTRDWDALTAIERLFSEQQKVFVFINKIGAHVPYAQVLPPEQREGDRLALYDAAVRHNSVLWLEQLVKIAKKHDVVVVYTSDHGQNLSGGATHGNTGEEAHRDEWTVPIGLLLPERLRAAKIASTDRAVTHFEASEAVRNLLGFQTVGIASLFGEVSTRADFCAYYGPPKALLGRPPRCKLLKVDVPESQEFARR